MTQYPEENLFALQVEEMAGEVAQCKMLNILIVVVLLMGLLYQHEQFIKINEKIDRMDTMLDNLYMRK